MEKDGMAGYERLFAEIEGQSDFRHDIIHGMVIDHAEGSGEAKLVRFLHSAEGLDHEHFSADITTILKAAVDAQKLGEKTLMWVNQFLDELPKFAQSDAGRTP